MERPLWQKALAAAVLLIVAVWASYNYYFSGKLKELSKLQETLVSIEREINLIKPTDIIIGKDTSSLNREIEKQLNDISTRMPDEVELPYLIEDFISKSSSGSRVDYSKIQPLGVQTDLKARKQTINTELISDFEGLNLYLMKLESLPYIVRIDQMDISKVLKDKDLGIKLALSMFLFPGGVPSAESKPLLAQIPNFDPFYQAAISLSASKPVRYRRRIALRGSRLPKFLGVYRGVSTKAFINDSVVGPGGTVNGYMVNTITDKYIVVSRGNNRYTIRLGR